MAETERPYRNFDMLQPQEKDIVAYLDAGRRLSPMIAMTTLHIGSLSRRMTAIVRAGFPILKERKADHHGRQYISYSMGTREDWERMNELSGTNPDTLIMDDIEE